MLLPGLTELFSPPPSTSFSCADQFLLGYLLLFSTRSPISLLCSITFDMYIELKQTEKRFYEHLCLLQNVFAFFFWASCYCPLLGRTRCRDRCWAAILLCRHPEPSDSADHGEVDGLDIGDDTVDGLVFCTLTGRRGGRIPFVQAGGETSDTGAEAVKPDSRCSWKGHSRRVGASVEDESAESCRVVQPLRISSVIRPVRRTYVVVVDRWNDELLCGGYKWVSRFGKPCVRTRWAGDRWVVQMSRLHGTACNRKCGSLVTKLSRLNACENRKVVRYVFQGVFIF